MCCGRVKVGRGQPLEKIENFKVLEWNFLNIIRKTTLGLYDKLTWGKEWKK